MISEKKILVLGDIMLDRYWMGRVERISPEAPVPILDVTESFDKPGGAANVAQNLNDFGMDTTLIGLVGRDEASKSLKGLLKKINIDYHLIEDSNIRTTLKLRVIDGNQQLVRIDHEDRHYSQKMADSYNSVSQYLDNCEGIIVSDYDKGAVKPIIKNVIQEAKKKNIKIFIDPKGTDFSYYSGATLVKPNLPEFEIVMGKSNNNKEFLNKGEKLRDELKINYLLVTKGKNGMTLFFEGGNKSYDTVKHDVFDVTGAGDTVISILSSIIIGGEDIEKAVMLSNIAASLSIQKLGSTSVSQKELFDAVKKS